MSPVLKRLKIHSRIISIKTSIGIDKLVLPTRMKKQGQPKEFNKLSLSFYQREVDRVRGKLTFIVQII